MSNVTLRNEIKDYIFITLGLLLYAASFTIFLFCLLYTSDAADDSTEV